MGRMGRGIAHVLLDVVKFFKGDVRPLLIDLGVFVGIAVALQLVMKTPEWIEDWKWRRVERDIRQKRGY